MSYINPQGLRRSERIAKLQNPTTAVEATFEDVEEVVGSLPGASEGGKRKKGGSKTSDALAQLKADIDAGTTTLVDGLDSAAAATIEKLKTGAPVAAYGVGTAIALNNPTVFSNIIAKVYELGSAASQLTPKATWGDYLSSIGVVVTTGSKFAMDAVKAPLNSPAAALVLAAAIMKYRAGSRSMKQLLADDASAVMRGITGQIQGFNDEWEKEARQKAADTLRSIGERAKPTSVDPDTQESLKKARLGVAGIPAVRRGVEGSKGEVVQGLQPPGPASQALEPVTTGKRKRGGRRTKKSKKARKVTRRRPIFSY